jgi:hypothetical protein
MYNIPDDAAGHPLAPWNEQEWRCPECGGHQDDVECTPSDCRATKKNKPTRSRSSSMDRPAALAAWIVEELVGDRPVFDGHRHWTFDDVQERVDQHPDVARLGRMLVLATSNQQKERAASAYQLIFRRTAKALAEQIALAVWAHNKLPTQGA